MADPTFKITDLRGGINNSDSPTLLADNQLVDARNVDFRESALGSKRRGTEGINLSGAIFDSPVVALFRHTPTNAISGDELWAIDENGNLDRRVGESWQGGVARVNTSVTVAARNFDANAVSLHGKLFIAAKGTENRLLVWAGTVLRWAGIQQPPDPTVADSAVAGSYTGTRYVRIRFVAKDSTGVVLRRSEPTNAVSLAPSGTKNGLVVTKPAGTELTTSLYCEGQTHWEVEASSDNILFYRIATVAIATATYTDTLTGAAYSGYPLSEAIGEYIPPGAARHVVVDEDRIVVAGSHFTEALDSRVSWTPVAADDGVGNDERIPTTTRNYIAFDGLDGGRVNTLVAGVSSNVYVFKTTRVYKMVRTGQVTNAYQPVTESFARGSVLRGATAGSDQQGLPCVYFLDPSVGLCRLGQRGLEDLAQPIRNTWRGRNQSPAIGPRILYYPTQDQVWYTSPTLDVDEVQTSDGVQILTFNSDSINTSQTRPNLLVEYEVRYGGTMFHDGLLGGAHTLGLASRATGLAPLIGTQSTPIGGGNFSTIHYADTGTTDSGTAFRAYVQTKPYVLADLWTKFGLMAGMVLGAAASGTSLFIRMIRNFGVETRDVTVDMSPAATEAHVIKPIDNASMSELNAVQLEFGDAASSAQTWSLDQFVFKIRGEDSPG